MRHARAIDIAELIAADGAGSPRQRLSAGLRAANAARAWESGLKPVTLTQVWLHFGHRVGAVIVTGLIAALVVVVVRRHAGERALKRPAVVLAVLTAAQITLGVYTVLTKKAADVASAHVAVGALVLVTIVLLCSLLARIATGRMERLQRGG